MAYENGDRTNILGNRENNNDGATANGSVPVIHATNGNGNGVKALLPAPGALAKYDSNANGRNGVQARPLPVVAPKAKINDEATAALSQKSFGWREWGRMAQVARVLGGLVTYLYLDGYDIRYNFMRKLAARKREAARAQGNVAAFQEWSRDVDRRALDKLVRLVRRFVFRGADGSASKEAQLEKQAKWLSDNLVALGPAFIKIGQSLGTRADLLPLPYIKELALLQDQVRAFPTTEAYARIERELGVPLAQAYAEIDAEPVAAASLGQVYRARLHTGEEVAVKVQRPNLAENIALDLNILSRIVGWLNRYFPQVNENADWAGMLREFDVTIHEEMDYAQEGRNAERFRENFKEWRTIRVPVIYWTHTTERVLTMEFIRGTKVVDIEGLTARGFSPLKVNRLLVKTYLKQLLEDGFFHADPHPGNLLVMDNGRLAFFDFGMTGKITPQLQAQMIDAFFHVVSKDIQGLAQDLINLNFLKPGVDHAKVRPVIEGLFQHYLNLKLGEVRFKELTYDLAEVMYDYPFRLPSNFTYIIRALMTLEGIGIVTDPEFNFFDTAKPFAKEFLLRREGKNIRKLFLNKLTGRDADGKVDWGKMWKLAKMAAKTYFDKK